MTAVVTPAGDSVDQFDELVECARLMAVGRGRSILGIVGAPGAGKTTLAQALIRSLAASPPAGLGSGWVVHVPMDGFHLADVELERLGRRDRKGAPDTFDAAGYASLLQRLRRVPQPGEDPIYAPEFDRVIEQPVAGSIPVHPECRLIVSEGNYLLLDEPRWRPVRQAFHEIWFHDTDENLRIKRLVERHIRFGKTREQAQAWVHDVDQPNARLIEDSRSRADLVVGPHAVSYP